MAVNGCRIKSSNTTTTPARYPQGVKPWQMKGKRGEEQALGKLLGILVDSCPKYPKQEKRRVGNEKGTQPFRGGRG